MGFKKITKEGVNFLEYVARNSGYDGLIKGKNKYEIPFTYDVTIPSILSANIIYNGKTINNNVEFVKYLVDIYNMYGEMYDLDANIVLAQSYVESGLKVWNYAPYNSTATGISQFLIGNIYDVIIMNKYNINPKFSQNEINLMINNVIEPYNENSYMVGDTKELNINDKNFKTRSKSRKNRYNLLINAMNNPDLIIKAQFRFMKYIAQRNNNIASNTLFAYNRGSNYKAENYIDLVNYVRRVEGGEYIKEGVKYVEKIFGLLGDKDNINIKNKPKGVYFGYKLDLDQNNFNSYSVYTK